jgi:hypothetical protein
MRAPNNATLSAVDSGSEGGAALNDADALFTYQVNFPVCSIFVCLPPLMPHPQVPFICAQ